MPNYQYECTDCGHVQEDIVEFKNREKTQRCDECGHNAVYVISFPKFHLDGSDPNFVAAHDRWVKEHENAGKKKKKTVFKPKALKK